MPELIVRPYGPADRAAVLAILDSNLPEFFGSGDREWLEETLDAPDGPAFIVAIDGRPAAFGGYELWEHYNKALLYWGMAARDCHGLGLGRLLLEERLLHVASAARPATRYVTVDTSPMIAPFFRRCGFEQTAVWPEGYRSGMTMHELRFDLSRVSLAELEARRDAALSTARAAVQRKTR
ncbi:GNAT family N-acetyltransferase [Sphingomonadaceae bacterium jetA1]|jgi:GNAT superfamily N-acetyltransferase|uniref:GNAT family N-acetyltransferase n=1 Tax=Facivitalis istanbulensis TaxID=3075838 RepID=UPI0034990F70